MGMNGIKQVQQRKAEGNALHQNANAMEKQKEEAQDIFARKLMLLERDQTKYLGSWKSDFAKSGIDFSGSALEAYADTTEAMRLEKLALKADEKASTDRYDAEINRARKTSRQLKSKSANGMIIGQSLITDAFSFSGG